MFLFTKITLMILAIVIIVLVTEAIGILNLRYGYYILLGSLIMQFIILIILITLVIMRTRILKRGIKIVRHKFEDKYIKGDTDILPNFIGGTNPRKSTLFKIFVEIIDFKEPPNFGIVKTGKGNKTIDINKHVLNFRAGVIGSSFVFDADIIVRPDEKINFKFKDDANIKMFFVGELYTP